MQRITVWLGVILLTLASGPGAHRFAYGQATGAQVPPRPLRVMPSAATVEVLNAWTVGLAAGQLEGAPIRFATEIARVVDDDTNLHVLPIVTRGPAENVEDLLYLRGVDLAIINTDS